eukprot:NODE_11498_length_203_cov_97.792208_g10883_i0.p1 GENE.NODE_11498_length_203_cov_97.792208_g10883_i0~~NODE_11498_length_203_cov_97.792208_g10883_i0.p1  ORF type:complete len:53 (-),score=18.94 NODE_11498_length_203_cov_97.792208_g10883_i0:45-176(-)
MREKEWCYRCAYLIRRRPPNRHEGLGTTGDLCRVCFGGAGAQH